MQLVGKDFSPPVTYIIMQKNFRSRSHFNALNNHYSIFFFDYLIRCANFGNSHDRINGQDHRMEASVLVAGLGERGIRYLYHMFDNFVTYFFTTVHSCYSKDQISAREIHQ